YIGAGKEIVNKNLGAESDFEVYTEFDTPYTYTFVAPADKVYLEIFLSNTYGEGNNKNPENGLWMDIDMVSVTGDEVGGVNDVIVADTNAPVEYFNLQGVRVANPENGLFIRRQGKTTTKVVL
ncbi:MAG: hypothetical protein K2F91_01475, partial [Muribaculaceae bacterium]|nr:hypothetical protein [Muribaculaceae bacterium]